MHINKLGWNDYFENQFQVYNDQGLIPARVITQQSNNYVLYHEGEYINAELSGKFLYNAYQKKDYPAVGDWVAVKVHQSYDKAIIQALLERKSYLARKLPISGGRKIVNGMVSGGSTEEQVIASNIDTVFIVVGLDDNFNIQRIERYLTITYNSGASPVIILNKIDICDCLDECIEEMKKITRAVPIHPISVVTDQGMEVFDQYLDSNQTVTFVGSSGVGKSTIINSLIGEELQATKSVSQATGKGKHTTTHRELFFRSAGGMVIDTPGIREVQLWSDEKALGESFDEIKSLELNCKFRDCKHDTEPGCAIKQAIEDGVLSEERFESYKKQLDELRRLNRRQKEQQKNLERKMKKKKKYRK